MQMMWPAEQKLLLSYPSPSTEINTSNQLVQQKKAAENRFQYICEDDIEKTLYVQNELFMQNGLYGQGCLNFGFLCKRQPNFFYLSTKYSLSNLH